MRLAEQASADAIPFATEMIEELGASRLLHGQLAGAECVVAVPSAAAPATDGPLFARIAPGCIHLFDGQAGNRIEPAHAALVAE